MSVKAFLYSLGCLVAWFVFMPALVVGGGFALLAYAIFAEIGSILSGSVEKPVDQSTARAMAYRIGGRTLR